MDEFSIGYAVLHHVLPGVVAGVVAAAVWYASCWCLCRGSEQVYREAIKLPANFESQSLVDQISIAADRRKLVSRGGPVDRLFFFGLMLGAALLLACFILWSLGVLPASPAERRFIEDVRSTQLVSRPQLAAALAETDDAVYVSRRDFWYVESAIRR